MERLPDLTILDANWPPPCNREIRAALLRNGRKKSNARGVLGLNFRGTRHIPLDTLPGPRRARAKQLK